MPYVYRYIDMVKKATIYVGKVSIETILNRHRQHMYDSWYNADTTVLQYVECATHTDADMLETWLINYYGDQLANKAKTGWGKSNIDLSKYVFGKWVTLPDDVYKLDCHNAQRIYKASKYNVKSLISDVYISPSITFNEFMSSMVMKDTENRIERGLLYNVYMSFCTVKGYRAIRKNAFYTLLRRTFSEIKTCGAWYFIGLRFLQIADENGL